MGIRDIMQNSAGRRGQAFPGTLASKDPAALENIAGQLDSYANEVDALGKVEATFGNTVVGDRAPMVADAARGEAARYRKTGWLRSR